ncbi:MAG: hypothetical protein ACKOB0_14355, partial [Chthoniobacterales bacterium]
RHRIHAVVAVFRMQPPQNLDQCSDWGLAVCPFSEAGFLRLSLNPAFVAGQAPVGTLIEILRRLHSKRGYHRMDSVPDPSDARFSSLWEKVRGHRQVTDAVLLCMAIDEDVRLATMDRSIATLADRPDRVVLID